MWEMLKEVKSRWKLWFLSQKVKMEKTVEVILEQGTESESSMLKYHFWDAYYSFRRSFQEESQGFLAGDRDLETISTERIEWNCLQKCEDRREKRAQDHDLELEQEKRVWRRERKFNSETEGQGSRDFSQGGGGGAVHKLTVREEKPRERLGAREEVWVMTSGDKAQTALDRDAGMPTRNWRQQG